MIQFENVSFSYHSGQRVLDDLSFTIDDGARIGLIGANGAGKTTIMKAMLGLIPFEGCLKVDGMHVNKENIAEVRKRVGYVLQDSDNQMFMPTVYEDMMFGPMNYGMSKEEAEKCVDETLEKMDLMHLKYRRNYRMSGGEKRMAAIATILVMNPQYMLMDEPSITLDPKNRRKLIQRLNEIPVTKIIATHDLDLVLECCDKVILLYQGKLIAYGGVQEVLWNRELLETYHLELPLCLAGIPAKLR